MPHPEQAETPRALGGLRVLDLADRRGHYCGKLLGDLGASVIKIEPPGGDAARRIGPFQGDVPHPERSLYFLSFNTNKLGIVLDLERPEERSTFLRLVRSADVLIESFPPGYLAGLGLDYGSLQPVNPGLVMASITGYGQSGPHRDYQATDIVAFAMSGLMYLSGDPAKPPLTAPCEQAYHNAAAHAAYAILVALYNRLATGQGQHIDISMQESLAGQQFLIVRYHIQADLQVRASHCQTGVAPGALYPCRDGQVSFFVMGGSEPGSPWRRFREWIGNPQALQDAVWDDRRFRRANVDVLDLFIRDFTLSRTKEELFAEAQARHIPCTPVNSPQDFVCSPQTQARAYFVEAEHPETGRHLYPGAPYKLSQTPWALGRTAPLLGQHQAQVLAELEVLEQRPAPAAALKRLPADLTVLFHGVRLADFTQAWAGPFCTRLLADHGAQVVKIESRHRPDNRGTDPGLDPQVALERNAMFADLNRNKKSISVDLNHPQGRAVIRRLIAVSDVVVENFSYRVMPKWGLDYPSLRQLRPDIVMASLQGLGQTGPYREYVTWGPNLMPLTGMTYLWGFPDSPEAEGTLLAYPDYVAGVHGALAIVAALLYRERTGQGQHIDLAQVEATASLLGPVYLDYLVNGRVSPRWGNRDPACAPQGCYRCKGDDQWCVISITSHEVWQRFCQAVGRPEWGQDPRFQGVAERRQHHDLLDRLIEEWTQDHTPHQVMRLLQRAGVPAGAVQNAEHLFFDPHLRARGYIVRTHHPDAGPLEQPGIIARLSQTPGDIYRPAPALGQHNEEVFGELLGMSRREMEALAAEGALY